MSPDRRKGPGANDPPPPKGWALLLAIGLAAILVLLAFTVEGDWIRRLWALMMHHA